MLKKSLLAFFIVLLTLFLGCSGSNQNSTTGNVVLRNPIAQCKDVQVPYQAVETYIEREPYQAIEEYQLDLKFRVEEAYHRGSLSDITNYKEKGIVVVTNTDSETGIFQVDMIFQTLNRGSKTLTSRKQIMPGETVNFELYYDIDYGEDCNFKYNVIPGKKTLTRYVTKYRNIERTRTVTKYKTERVCE